MRHRTPDRVVELDEPEWRQNVPLTTLVRESNMVIIAAPVRNSYRQFQDGHVVTDYQIRVEEVIEGDLIPSSMISVIMPGGLVRESNGEWLRVQTRRLRKMENGKTYLLFLKPAGRGSGRRRGPGARPATGRSDRGGPAPARG